MTDEALYELLDDVLAYESGSDSTSLSSHGHAIAMSQLHAYLRPMSKTQATFALGGFISQYILSADGVRQGYGFDDVIEFINWVRSDLHLGMDI